MNQKNKFKRKEMENAEIKASLMKNKALSLKRLLHDYEEIKNQIVPIPGVSAFPLDDDMYEWHGNIKALAVNIYKGAVLHFRLSFPKDYPISPPDIYILNKDFTHPNILENGKICLNMFEKNKYDYNGWKSGYTILSILLQLQSLFFEVNENFLTEKRKKKIKEELISLSDFNCSKCKHKGSINPFPNFPEESELNKKLTLEQYKQVKKEELCCYFLKENFQKIPIGLGIKISKIKNSNEIISISSCFDFISLKAFSKEKLRVSFDGKRFTHWFPLYFGEKEKKDLFLNSATKAISMILKGNTKEFEPNLIIKIMPKLFDSIFLSMVKENVHVSSKVLEILIYIYRILIIFVKTFPEFRNQINSKIKNFIKFPENRNINITPSLSELLCMLSISEYSIDEILPFFISENYDRRIPSIIKKSLNIYLYEFENIDSMEAKLCFKGGRFDYLVLLFYYYFIKKIVFNNNQTLDDFAAKLDQNYGCLTEIELDRHRNEFNKILKIEDYNEFYEYLGMKSPNIIELNEIFKIAIKNYRNKNYDLYSDSYIIIPSDKEQIKLYMKRYASFEELLENEKLMKSENPKWRVLVNRLDIVKQYKYKYPKSELTPLDIIKFSREISDEKLFFEVYKKEKLIIENKKEKNKYFQKTFKNIVKKEENKNKKDKEKNNNIDEFGKKEEKVRKKIKLKKYNFDSNYNVKKIVKNKMEIKINKRKFIKKIEDEQILSQLNWRQLYLKLYFEDYCKYFNYIADFKQLNKLLDYIKQDIIHFSFIISDDKNLKSNYNYVRIILSKLSSLKYLELIFTKKINQNLLKNLEKGIINGLKENTSIEHLKVIINKDENKNSSISLNKLAILDHLPNLKILDISNMLLFVDEVKKIKNNLYIYKTLKVLDLSYCNLNDEMCTELADGIMKAKSLEKLYIVENKMNKGLSAIINNLAFQPSIKIIDISKNQLCDKNEVVISLLKLIKMSKTIEIIICNNIPELNNALNKEFFCALGNNSNLSYLDLSYNGKFSDINLLGMALAFNALKKGSLSYIDISGTIYKYDVLNNLIKSMAISENDLFEWYGYGLNSTILKESPEYYNKIYHCNLKTLVLKDSDLVSIKKETKSENYMKILLNKSQSLDTLILDNSRINKNFMELISESLQFPNNLKYVSFSNCNIVSELILSFLSSFYEINKKDINFENKIKMLGRKKKRINDLENINCNKNLLIKELDFSCNKISYSGINLLSKILIINKTIEYLNLFHNRIGVSGSLTISKALKENNIIKELDLGYNRIKNNGFKMIINGIMQNTNSVLKKLGMKYNFIKNDELENEIEIIEKSDNNSLEEIELKNNLLSSEFLSKLWSNQYLKMYKNIKIDIFEILYYLEPERLGRTIWLNTNQANEKVFKNEKFSYNYMGIPLSIKKIRGRKIGHKKDENAKNAFIEFISPLSVEKAIKEKKTSYFLYFSEYTNNIYKAGTEIDYFFVKKKKY